MPSAKPKGSSSSRSEVRARAEARTPLDAPPVYRSIARLEPVGVAKTMTTRCGTPCGPPHASDRAHSARYRPAAACGSDRSSGKELRGEVGAHGVAARPRASSPAALSATCSASSGGGSVVPRIGHRRRTQPRPCRFAVAHPRQQVARGMQMLVAEAHQPLKVPVVDGRRRHSSSTHSRACRPPSCADSMPRRTSACRSRSAVVSPG